MKTNNDHWLARLRDVGAIVPGHFVLKSGRHSDIYFDKDAIFPHANLMQVIASEIAEQFMNLGVETVIAPAVGAVALCHLVVSCLAQKTQVKVTYPWATFARKSSDGNDFEICGSHIRYIHGKRVLVAEDILTTGGSVRLVIDGTRCHGGDVVGVGAICNRGGVTADILDVPKLFAVVTAQDATSWDERDCPLCLANVPVHTKLGHGQKFLDRKRAEATE